jgi:hypothetical protein
MNGQREHPGLYSSPMSTVEGLTLWDAFWSAVALNFSASCLGLVLVMTGHWDLGFLLPLTCMAMCGVFGLVAMLPRRTRNIGGGSVLGVLVSVLGYVAVLVIVFVGYFVIGGNELS